MNSTLLFLASDADGIGGAIAMLILIVAGVFIYFVPTAIAVLRQHHNAVAIALVNIFSAGLALDG